MIHYLSYPDNQSINHEIPAEESYVQYSSVAVAITFIQQSGPGAFCSITDIKSAFRLVDIHHSQFKIVGFRWDNKYYIDTCLQFGHCSSFRIFERFSAALQWIARNKLGISCISHAREFFTHMETSPLPVKGCKF